MNKNLDNMQVYSYAKQCWHRNHDKCIGRIIFLLLQVHNQESQELTVLH